MYLNSFGVKYILHWSIKQNKRKFLFHSVTTVTLSVNKPISSSDFTTLITSFLYSFKMNGINSFSALTSLFSRFFLSNLFIKVDVVLPTNAREKATFLSAFLLKLPNREQRTLQD